MPMNTSLLMRAVVASCLSAGLVLPADFPEARISNGQITASLFLPDASRGYYRSTRFDWSGAVNSLTYGGHNFYGVWYDRIDPTVINWKYENGEIVAGPCSALYGPVDEFAVPLGYDEAKPGGTFIKLGVGVLRKTSGEYNRYFPYQVLNPGKWTVETKRDSVSFAQDLSDPESGYSYVYRKVVRLTPGKPEMTIEHTLKNTGKQAIQSQVYNHNFVVLDKQAPGPDFAVRVPFEISVARPTNKALIDVKGRDVVYAKPLTGEDQAVVAIQGFGNSAKDAEVVIENKKAGAGVRITGDRPLVRSLLWSIRTVLAIEPYVAIDVQPGAEFSWKNVFDYYTVKPKP